jgi:FKBP-type peptidyl-prolyl cis-trans isomerase FkpA
MFRLSRPALAVVVALLGGVACAGGPTYSPSNPAPWDPESITFADSMAVDLSAMQMTPAGLYFEDLTQGEGATAQRTSLVSLHYIGYLPDGTVFDASVGGEPFQFRLGANEVIRGWNLGVPGMKEGGVRRLVIRPALAYRGKSVGKVPPNSTLVFDMKLLSVR